MTSDSNYDEFTGKVRAKFGLRGGEEMRIQFKDEDGGMISLVDEVSRLSPSLTLARVLTRIFFGSTGRL